MSRSSLVAGVLLLAFIALGFTAFGAKLMLTVGGGC